LFRSRGFPFLKLSPLYRLIELRAVADGPGNPGHPFVIENQDKKGLVGDTVPLAGARMARGRDKAEARVVLRVPEDDDEPCYFIREGRVIVRPATMKTPFPR